VSDSSGGLGSGTDSSQGDRARANASQQQGNGKLLGARGDRDVSRPDPASIPPPPLRGTEGMPKQPVGNAKTRL
jgi:hypothetical protein